MASMNLKKDGNLNIDDAWEKSTSESFLNLSAHVVVLDDLSSVK